MPPATEPRSRNFLDDTVFWIIAAEQEREAMRTHTSPATRHGRKLEHSVSRSAICREHAPPADPNRFAANRLASSTSSVYRDEAGRAMRVLSAFRFVSPLPSKVFAVSGTEEKPKVESRCDAVVIGSAYLLPALSVAGASLASP